MSALEIEQFLSLHPPFLGADSKTRAQLARAATRQQFDTGARVVESAVVESADVGDDAMWIVFSGRVVILHPDDAAPKSVPIDSITSGGVFGFSTLLSGSRAGFIARTTEPTVLYRLPGEVVRPLFATPSGLSFLADALSSVGPRAEDRFDSTVRRAVGELVSAPPVFAAAATSVRDAARHMTDSGSSYVLIPLGAGEHGIFTDRDLRVRVVAAGVSVDVPVEVVMTAPAETVRADRSVGEVSMNMLERGFRHIPVLSDRGEVLGVLDDADLHAASTRGSFVLRRALSSASTRSELAEAAHGIPRLVTDMFRGGTEATAVSAILSVVVDAVVRRALEIEWAAQPEVPQRDFAWVTLGSVARRESVLSSDVDSALTWADRTEDPGRTRDEALMDLARRVHRVLDDAGLPGDSNGAIASSPRFARSSSQWRSAAAQWLSHPFGSGKGSNAAKESGLIMSSLMIDGRVVWGQPALHTVPEVYRSLGRDHPETLRLQLRDALAAKARLRSMRDVLARRGGTFDLKSHALTPIVNLARWGGISVGLASASTPERLQAAAGNGMLSDRDTATLTEVFALLQRLRLGHQIEQVAAGRPPSDILVMSDLSPLERGSLTDGVREIAAVQRRVGNLASTVGVHR